MTVMTGEAPRVLDALRVVLESITALAALTVAFAAWRGVSLWRAQLEGTAEYEVARRVLREVYRLRSAVASARAPGSFAGEAADRTRQGDEPQETAQALDLAHVYSKRMDRVLEVRTALQLTELEALALWGAKVSEVLGPLYDKVGELFAAHNIFHNQNIRQARRRQAQDSTEQLRRFEGIIWAYGSGDGKDDFAAGFSKAVQDAEGYFRPFITSQATQRSATRPTRAE